mmetsp:Transcript_12642/g.26638  ORF Transcript_12642/g.26638 Transcript_12642/m.26638 type:complete len:212 (-) Transcript_12642:824-1459(-)
MASRTSFSSLRDRQILDQSAGAHSSPFRAWPMPSSSSSPVPRLFHNLESRNEGGSPSRPLACWARISGRVYPRASRNRTDSSVCSSRRALASLCQMGRCSSSSSLLLVVLLLRFVPRPRPCLLPLAAVSTGPMPIPLPVSRPSPSRAASPESNPLASSPCRFAFALALLRSSSIGSYSCMLLLLLWWLPPPLFRSARFHSMIPRSFRFMAA